MLHIIKKGFAISLFVVFALISLTMIGYQQEIIPAAYNPENIEQMNYDVDSDQYFDTDGNLLVPYDVAFKENFESGDVQYDKDTFLIKFDKTFDGNLTRNLKSAGITDLTFSFSGNNTAWYEASIGSNLDILSVVNSVRQLDNVLVADYNYIYQTDDIISSAVAMNDISENPLSTDQWYLEAYGISDAWTWLTDNGYDAGGSSSVVVAVIDTGVDYTHKDLAANMWVNTDEIPGNNIDDDDNGYVDDIYGANVVSDDRFENGNPMDDHGHGTHVAGVIAAENNKEGTVGIAYNTKIMAVKAGQASGYFMQTDIAEAILYAYDNGADVINMSFGGTGMSIAVQDALMTAYTRSVLVASAGNSGAPNEYVPGYITIPNYPAAYSYVIGVMSVNSYGTESGFSNWDVNKFNSVEYEVYAPGEQIMSTLPNDNYAAWSGTSMAAPVVSAIAALIRSVYSDRDMYPNKFIMGQLISTSEEGASCINPAKHGLHNVPMIVNAYRALTVLPKPDVNLYNYFIYDSETIDPNNNGDGIIDSGETIDLGLILRNRWGMSENTIVSIDATSPGGVENPYVTFLTNDIDYGGVGTYSTKDLLTRDGSIVTGVETPFRIQIDENTPNDYIINLNVTIQAENALDSDDDTVYETYGLIQIVVRNGYILPNIVEEDMTLTKDNYYIIPNSMIIKEGATVTVEPGTKIQFWTDDPNDPYADTAITYLKVEGKFITQGTEDEMVELFPSELMSNYRVEIFENNNGYVELNHTKVTNGFLDISVANRSFFNMNYLGKIYFRYLSSGTVENSYSSVELNIAQGDESIFYVLGSNYSWSKPWVSGNFNDSIFVDSAINFDSSSTFDNCVFLNNNTSNYNYDFASSMTLQAQRDFDITKIVNNNETGKTYILVNTNDYIYQDNISKLDKYIDFAKMYGGSIVNIETDAEQAYLNQNFSIWETYYTGLHIDQNGDYIWENNEPYTGSSTVDLNSRTYARYYAYDDIYNNESTSNIMLEMPSAIYVNGITTSETSVNIDMESQYQIKATLNPSTANLNNLIYISDDEGVVTVSESGLVQPVSYGTATVYIYSDDYQRQTSISINVVQKVDLISIDASMENYQLSINTTHQIDVNFNPLNTTQRELNYTSDDETVASVDSFGLISANGVGQATITVSNSDDSISDSFDVTVVSPVTSIAFEESTYVTNLDSTDDNILPLVLPLDATNRNLVWRSSNPEVAYVNGNNELIKLSTGVTTLIATVENTNLSAELIVSVSDSYEPNEVVKIIQIENYYIALYGDGNIYYWGNDVLSPKRLDLPNVNQKIMDFAQKGSNYLFVLLEDGSIKTFYDWNWTYCGDSEAIYESNDYGANTLSMIVQIEQTYNGYSVYFLKNDGSVWALGQNNHGQLGDGTKTDRDSPVQSLVQNVVDIAGGYNFGMFLDSNENLYVAGGYNAEITTPLLINQGINSIESYYNYYYISATSLDTISYYSGGDSDYSTPDRNDIIFGYDYLVSSSHYYIDDGLVYVKGSNNDKGQFGIGTTSNANYYTQMLKVENVSQLFIFTDNTFIQTTDGKFYGTGLNNNYQLANFKTENSSIPVRIFFGLEGNGGGFSVENVNIVNQELFDNQVIIDFNEALVLGDNYVYITLKDSQDQTLAILKTMDLDTFTISPFSGWIVGETYTLTIPAGSLSTKFMIGNEALTYTFTYIGDTTPISLLNSSISYGEVLTDNNIDIDLEYTVANIGQNFDQIQILDDTSTPVNNVDVSLSNNILTISGMLDYGDYTLVIPAGALEDNVSGNNLEYQATFSIVQTLQLESATHNDGDIRKPVDESMVFTFNVANEYTAFAGIQLLDSSQNPVDVTITLVDNTLTIDPTNNLVMGQTYTILIPEDALIDDLGNTNTEISNTFTTYDPIGLYRTSISDGQDNVNPGQTIRIFYNYAEAGDLFNNIALLDAENNPVDFDVVLFDNVLSITPSGSYSTTYSLTIPAGALLDEQGVLNNELVLNFLTITQSTRFFYTSDFIKTEYNTILEQGSNTNITNSAILNNFNFTDLEMWLRFTAQTSDGYEMDEWFETIGMGGNYWGTTDPVLINKMILDFDDYQSLWNIEEGNILQTPPENTFPFVTDVYLLNSLGERVSTVGNETISVVVEFNRDMDTTVDLDVRFGSSLPFAEYQISGSYVTPRKWVGTYTLTTIIENGNQFFYIDNGHVDGDSWLSLQPDCGRFTFEIDTTGAQAMIMQGLATDTGINLTWMQDDFETLAGYNVYRSTSEDGFYQRLNDSLIPTDVKEFFDDTVEPGVVYYYNFTVVKTDLTESIPSGKIVIMSKDTMAPNIYHTPIYQAYTNSNLVISATVTDNLMIDEATLYYRIVGETEWHQALMTNNNDRYSAIVSSDYITLAGFEYYIEAYDGVSYTYKGTADDPYVTIVKEGIDANSLGDVNGDGSITVLDALMTLQAINDRLNLTSDQFTRADLDSSGTLEAWEALKILQYVSGKITSMS